jgi:hypothetical protein
MAKAPKKGCIIIDKSIYSSVLIQNDVVSFFIVGHRSGMAKSGPQQHTNIATKHNGIISSVHNLTTHKDKAMLRPRTLLERVLLC